MLLKPYEDYSKHVNDLFVILSKELRSILPDARIEHIGSSAVPGSISKGDLDVFVGVDHSHFNQALSLIKSLDFYEKKGTFRSDELCMLVTDKFNYDVAVQLVSNGSEFEDFLKFRDLLKTNDEFVKEYNEVKLMAQYLDGNEYRQKKSIFITKILNS
ncbi:GrpB family protein [Bacteriovorax sp. PP10]|uniref:GrpB family protein n=1 Tax=Bacteriovorax antarcticus TaxID=3088717 RepID=A0ABU5VWY8_9BACT|nr:GrpB family protein [Bacteriovorax sp. PP10]MEA9357583.1 GrpB family protein [Bacteriovorax sp. PP10]